MNHVRLLSVLVLFTSPLATACAAEPALDGIWKLSYAASAELESNVCLIRLETRDGRLTGTLLASVPSRGTLTLERVHRDSEQVRLVLKGKAGETSFEGRPPPREGTVILGSYGDERHLDLARLTRTERTELGSADLIARQPLPPPLKKLKDMQGDLRAFSLKMLQAKDAQESTELAKEMAAARRAVQAGIPRAYAEVVARYPDSQAVFEAALNLLRTAGPTGASPEQVEGWALALTRAAEPYGRRWHQEVTLRAAELLGLSPAYAPLALSYAQRAAARMTAQDASSRQVRVLQALAAAQQRAGMTTEARQTEARLAKLEEALDKEYRSAFPPLKVATVASQSKKGNRAVVLELFTGVSCPFCESTYLAFEALRRAYAPGDLLLIQYHVPYFGPDPLANAAGRARWDYYAKAFSKEIRATPATLFNGRFEAIGGSHASHAKTNDDRYADARKKYNLSSEMIDEILETPAVSKVTAHAQRQGEKIAIRVEVRHSAAPGDTIRLRLVLVEDTVRYVGPNNLRFHHHVARSMPGGPEGVALKDKDSAHGFTVDLTELRDRSYRYLDDPAVRAHLLPNAYRPLHFENLHLIAFVQDDRSGKILQGCLAAVLDDTAGK